MTPLQVAGKQSQYLAKLEINGAKVGKIVFGAQISIIAKFFRAGWDAEDCATCENILFDEFKYLKAAEFKYFVNKVLGGYYTSPKNLSPAIIAEWLRKFSDEILKAREDANDVWKPPDNPVPEEVWNQHFTEVKRKLIEKVQQQDKERKTEFPTLEQSIQKIKALRSEESDEMDG